MTKIRNHAAPNPTRATRVAIAAALLALGGSPPLSTPLLFAATPGGISIEDRRALILIGCAMMVVASVFAIARALGRKQRAALKDANSRSQP